MTAACTAVAVTGSVRRRHTRWSGDFHPPASDSRNGRGNPQASTAPAPDEASSNVATSMISSCSIMCIAKLRSPASWSGEVSDSVSTVQPERNSTGCTGTDARFDRRTQPTT